jgi:hypothetical protein
VDVQQLVRDDPALELRLLTEEVIRDPDGCLPEVSTDLNVSPRIIRWNVRCDPDAPLWEPKDRERSVAVPLN